MSKTQMFYKFAPGDQVKVSFQPPTNGVVVSVCKEPDTYNVRLEAESNDVRIHAAKLSRH